MPENEKEGPVTEFFHKQAPHLTGVVLIGFAFVCANAAGPMLVFIENMQNKAKTVGLDWFDLSRTLIYMAGIIGSTIIAYLSKKPANYDEAVKKHREACIEFETNHLKGAAKKIDPEGHLR